MQSGSDQHKDELLAKGLDMHAHGKSFDDIEIELLRSEQDQDLVAELMSALRKHIHKKNMKDGRALILAGCIVMVFGFVLTCIKFHSNESVNMVMYGFTTLGICILFVGLYKIFN